MQLTQWGPAVAKQLEALQLISLVVRNKSTLHKAEKAVPSYRWEVEEEMLRTATPFAWGDMPAQAVLTASKSIPDDALFNAWNMPAEMQWWHFEKPVMLSPNVPPLRAVLFGWLTEARDQVTGDVRFKVGDGFEQAKARGDLRVTKYLACACYSDDEQGQYPIMAGATWRWEENDTVDQMCDRGFKEHQRNYGPDGRFVKDEPEMERNFEQTADFINHTRALSKFVLAALAWLNQKIVVITNEQVTPKRSTAYKTATGRDLSRVRVISLRKAEPRESTALTGDAKWRVSVQFVVEGHWRNQPCGPQRIDRRLIFISPFLKGPDKAPFKAAGKKVFTVDR